MANTPAHNRLAKPTDFRAIYVAQGWAGIRSRYGVGTDTIRRWVDEEGRDRLYADRAAYLAHLTRQVQALRRHFTTLGAATGSADVVHHFHAAERAISLGIGDLHQQRDERLRR